MKLAWVHYFDPRMAGVGIARGYVSSAYFMWAGMKKWLGAGLVDCTSTAPAHPRVHLHYCPPHLFRPVPGKLNVLFSMWEAPLLPEEMRASIASADVNVVPSEFCRSTWASYGVDAEIVRLGVPGAYLDVDPSRPLIEKRQLRFLWLGAPILRKGYGLLASAWRKAFGRAVAPPRLTMKVIGDGSIRTEFAGSIVIDQRDLEPIDVLKLYLDADVFVSTSVGEGFGLPALEAMAAGCLVVAPETTGLREFVRGSTAVVLPARGRGSFVYGPVEFETPVVMDDDLAFALSAVARDWGMPALEATRQNGIRAARELTWDRTVDELLALVGRVSAADRASRPLGPRPLPVTP